MSGYTPAFADMFMGTLFGRWPAAPVWATLLPLMDKQGRIDMAPQAIAGMTGWPLALLEEGIRQLMEPDPASRTPGNDGRRLLPLDATRPWGWLAVNHSLYREKARKQFHNGQAIETGTNKQRLKTRRDQTRPDATGSQKQTQTHTQTQTEEPRGANAPGELPEGSNPRSLGTNPRAVAQGLDSEAWQQWLDYRRNIRKPIKSASLLAAQEELAGHGTEQAVVVKYSIAQGYQGLYAPKGNGAKKPYSPMDRITYRPTE